MRKLIYAALVVVALGALLGSTVAYAGDCCQPKCKQTTCTKSCDTGCKQSCCKPKCDSCKPKCDTCKPKCDSCKPKCKQNTCSKPCAPKCDTCKPKCDSCKPKCSPCKSKCGNPCKNKCNSGCEDPYAAMWRNGGMVCDTGCCGGGYHIPKCVTCETVCKTVETTDPCTGCTKVEYVYETVCKELERPHVIPWWFNETGAGNIYLDAEPATEVPAEAAAE
jgi:hypothetical protein